MSRSWERETYTCVNPCGAYGDDCKGHILEVEFHHTSDTTIIKTDNETRTILDDGAWGAICRIVERRLREPA